MEIFRELLWYFKMEKKSYFFGISALIIVAVLNLLPPYVVGIIVDKIENDNLLLTDLIRWGLLLFLVGVIMYGLRYVWRVGIFGPSFRLGRLLRDRLYQHFTKMSPQFFHRYRTGDLMAHSTNDIQAIEVTAGQGILTLIDSVITGSLVIFSMIFFISWQLTFLALLPMPVLVLATNHYGKLLHKRFHKAQAAFANLNDKVQENISGVRVIKAFGQEKPEENIFQEISEDVVEKNIKVAKIDALFTPTIQLLIGISLFISIATGSVFVVKEELTIGQLTQFTLYLGQLTWPMLAFGWLFNIVERGRASYDRVKNLLEVQPQVQDKEGAIAKIPQGDLEYNITSFSYPQKTTADLENIRVAISRGQTLGIVGRTGSGKTTFLRLLLREFDIENGDITIGGTSIYDYALASLRKAVGYVPQDHFLFSATIKENIAFGKPEAKLEEVIKVAKLANIHNDILQLTNGYDTLVGEKGVTLSGGQKQRISIARALLLNPEILILDDALSAVDAKTEETILKALRQNRLNQTTLIAAHRLSAVEHADLIIVLEEGKIIEKGKHQELIEKDGWYSTMYQSQQLEQLVAQGGK